MSADARSTELHAKAPRTRRVPAAEARVEPCFAPARVLRRESLDAVAALESARVERDAARRELEAARLEADRIVAVARQERDDALAAARVEADEQRRAGFEAGRADATTRIGEIAQAIGRADKLQREQYPQLVRDAAFRLARAILDVEFVVRPEHVRELVVAALERAGSEEVIVELSQTDHAVIGVDVAKLAANVECKLSRVRVADDLADRHVRIVTASGARWTIGLDQAFADLRAMVERTYSRGERR